MKALSTLNISFGLLTIQTKVYPLRNSKEDKINFVSLSSCCHKETGLQRYCKECEKEQDWRTDLKGFKISKNNFVELTKEELSTIDDLENGIEILKFCALSTIPFKVLDKPYLLEPIDNKTQRKLYALFNSAFAELNACAIAKTIIKGNEHFSIIRHSQEGLILQYVERTSDITIEMPSQDLNPLEVNEVKKLIQNNLTEFSFDFFNPIYVNAVRKMIEAKATGHTIEIKEMNTNLNSDLLVLDALKQMNAIKEKELIVK